MEYEVIVKLKVIADSEDEAFNMAESAVENLVGGEIVDAEIYEVNEAVSA